MTKTPFLFVIFLFSALVNTSQATPPADVPPGGVVADLRDQIDQEVQDRADADQILQDQIDDLS